MIKSSKYERVKNVNFSISVGTHVPKTVHFYTVTPEIVTIYPRYRGFKFFLVSDEIIIVDPSSYEIVQVISL